MSPEQPVEEQAAEPAPVPRNYLMPVPSLADRDGAARVRLVGPDDPVKLRIPGVIVADDLTTPCVVEADDQTAWPDVIVHVSLDAAWALWAVLSDALMGDPDAVPEWTAESVGPLDDDGNPLADPLHRLDELF